MIARRHVQAFHLHIHFLGDVDVQAQYMLSQQPGHDATTSTTFYLHQHRSPSVLRVARKIDVAALGIVRLAKATLKRNLVLHSEVAPRSLPQANDACHGLMSEQIRRYINPTSPAKSAAIARAEGQNDPLMDPRTCDIRTGIVQGCGYGSRLYLGMLSRGASFMHGVGLLLLAPR